MIVMITPVNFWIKVVYPIPVLAVKVLGKMAGGCVFPKLVKKGSS